MSVMTFGLKEYANLAKALTTMREGRAFNTDRETRETCEQLALISVANVTCFNDKYRAHDLPYSAEDIQIATRAVFKTDFAQAVMTARMLEYNCVDNLDALSTVAGAKDALLHVMKTLMLVCASKAGFDS